MVYAVSDNLTDVDKIIAEWREMQREIGVTNRLIGREEFRRAAARMFDNLMMTSAARAIRQMNVAAYLIPDETEDE